MGRRQISARCTLFPTVLNRNEKKWDIRVYIDLYSGSGYARIENTSRILLGSPLIAASVDDPFDKYIFCEKDPDHLKALKARFRRLLPNADAEFIRGDCNEQVDEISATIPRASKNRRVLSLCFIDPFDISIKFSTVQRLSNSYIDFLILLALYMDANRNEAYYMSPKNRKVEDFLGLSDWRERWNAARPDSDFARFLAETYAGQMHDLGYEKLPFHKMRLVKSVENHRLYRLALFSRHTLAYQYWDEVLKYGTDQQSLSPDW